MTNDEMHITFMLCQSHQSIKRKENTRKWVDISITPKLINVKAKAVAYFLFT